MRGQETGLGYLDWTGPVTDGVCVNVLQEVRKAKTKTNKRNDLVQNRRDAADEMGMERNELKMQPFVMEKRERMQDAIHEWVYENELA